MRVAVFSTKPYDERFLTEANGANHELNFFEARLTKTTATLAAQHEAVCAFVNDELQRPVLEQLKAGGAKYNGVGNGGGGAVRGAW